MKRVFGLICVGVGFLFLVMAPLFRFYVGPASALAPLNVYTVTNGNGVIVKQIDIAKFVAGDKDPYYPANLPATSTRYTKGDVVAAEQEPAKSENLAIYETFSRTNIESDDRLVTAGDSKYAFGRQDSVLANCCGANVGGKSVNFTGNVPLKFPFFVQQQSYQVWDDQIQQSVTAQFQGEEMMKGVNSYKFNYVVPPTLVPNSSQTLPAKTLGLPGTADVTINPYYENDLTFWIEPLTGQVVATDLDTTTTFRGPDGQKDLATFLSMKFEPGDPNDASGSQGILADANKLNTIMYTVPMVTLILGIVLLIVGFLLLRAGAKGSKDPVATTTSGAPPVGGTPPPSAN